MRTLALIGLGLIVVGLLYMQAAERERADRFAGQFDECMAQLVICQGEW